GLPQPEPRPPTPRPRHRAPVRRDAGRRGDGPVSLAGPQPFLVFPGSVQPPLIPLASEQTMADLGVSGAMVYSIMYPCRPSAQATSTWPTRLSLLRAT